MIEKTWFSSRNWAGAGAAVMVLTLSSAAYADDKYAAIVLDATSNEVLHADQADALRYPASLTKMMTLYLLFDALDRGEIHLTDSMYVSRRAQIQPPSRLGLREGDSILVEDAIRALVTRSANDVAVVVAEKLDGSEVRFAQRMTAKARALGMRDTRYANASGLPDTSQVTTARDVLMLSQALLRDHPQRYDYFRTADFSWRNVYSRNHNNLLGHVDGVDGIKTGYTRASGFNLATSAVRNGHRIFAVVMGGESAATRDTQMAYLIDNAFATIEAKASGRPLAPQTQFTSLPVNRVTVSGAGVAPVRGADSEDMDSSEEFLATAAAATGRVPTSAQQNAPSAAPAMSTSISTTVTATQASYDSPSYVVPFPTVPRAAPTAPDNGGPAPATNALPQQAGGGAQSDAYAPSEGFGASVGVTQ